MNSENYIRVPKSYARVLNRMGLPEYKIIQENEVDMVISAPIELCRVLIRMGGEFKAVEEITPTDSDICNLSDELVVTLQEDGIAVA